MGVAAGCTPLVSGDEEGTDVGAHTHTTVADSPLLPFEGAVRRGESSAPVVIVEFADYNDCETRGHLEALEVLLDERAEQIQLAVRHAPALGDRESRHASMVMEAARRQGQFWEMRRLFAESCPVDERADRNSVSDRAMEFAEQLDMDVERFRLDANHPEILEAVQRDQRMARSLGVEGGPTFFVNGRRFSPRGVVEPGQFDERIDDAWQRALGLMGEGVDWSRLYREDVRHNLEADDRVEQPVRWTDQRESE